MRRFKPNVNTLVSASTSSGMPDHLHGQKGEYRVDGQIGLGGIARVCRAYHHLGGHGLAVKIAREDVSPLCLQLVTREISILESISYPHIIPVHDKGTMLGFGRRVMGHGVTVYGPIQLPFFVMPLIEAPTLGNLLDTDFQKVKFHSKHLALQMCKIVAMAHSKGIFHTDLKPDNFFVRETRDGDIHLLLIDFGMATVSSNISCSARPTKLFLGTEAYGAPELNPDSKHFGQIGPPTDVYSFGFLLYEMLANRLPFYAVDPGSMLRMHLYATPSQLPSDVHQDIAAVVSKALEKDPKNRFQSMGEMASAIRAARFVAGPSS